MHHSYRKIKEKSMRSEVARSPYRIAQIIDDINNNKLCFDHPCQRKVGRWNQKQALRLINSMLQKYPIPNVYILNEEKTKRERSNTIIDGNQRLHTIRMYFDPFSSTRWNFTEENVPSNCSWLAQILVNSIDNGIEFYYNERIFRLMYNNSNFVATIDEIFNNNQDEFVKPSYGQLQKIRETLQQVVNKLPPFLFGLFRDMEKWNSIIEQIEIGVTYVYLDEGEDENKILSEIFDRLNYGRTPKPAELINNLCYDDKLWKISSNFATHMSSNDKKAVYGYNNMDSYSDKKLFSEFQSNDRSDELFWGELFFSAYVYVIFNKQNLKRRGNVIIPYYAWNVELVRVGNRCIELKNYDVNRIENIDETIMAEVNEMMFQAFNLAKEVCVHISSQERHKKALAAVVLYCFYLVSKYNAPQARLNSLISSGTFQEAIKTVIISKSKQYEEINQKTNGLIQLCGI